MINTITQMNSPGRFALFLGDLSIFCVEDDIEEAFRSFGSILEIRIQRSRDTSRTLSYGFIEFSSAASAVAAMNGMNGVVLKGRPIRVRWAACRSSPVKSDESQHGCATIHVKFHAQKAGIIICEEVLRMIFCCYGEVADATIKKLSVHHKTRRLKGYGFVTFSNSMEGIASAKRAVGELHNCTIDSTNYKCELGNKLLQQQQSEVICPYSTQFPGNSVGSSSQAVPMALYQPSNVNSAIATPHYYQQLNGDRSLYHNNNSGCQYGQYSPLPDVTYFTPSDMDTSGNVPPYYTSAQVASPVAVYSHYNSFSQQQLPPPAPSTFGMMQIMSSANNSNNNNRNFINSSSMVTSAAAAAANQNCVACNHNAFVCGCSSYSPYFMTTTDITPNLSINVPAVAAAPINMHYLPPPRNHLLNASSPRYVAATSPRSPPSVAAYAALSPTSSSSFANYRGLNNYSNRKYIVTSAQKNFSSLTPQQQSSSSSCSDSKAALDMNNNYNRDDKHRDMCASLGGSETTTVTVEERESVTETFTKVAANVDHGEAANLDGNFTIDATTLTVITSGDSTAEVYLSPKCVSKGFTQDAANAVVVVATSSDGGGDNNYEQRKRCVSPATASKQQQDNIAEQVVLLTGLLKVSEISDLTTTTTSSCPVPTTAVVHCQHMKQHSLNNEEEEEEEEYSNRSSNSISLASSRERSPSAPAYLQM